jgi:hypothetical protein
MERACTMSQKKAGRIEVLSEKLDGVVCKCRARREGEECATSNLNSVHDIAPPLSLA